MRRHLTRVLVLIVLPIVPALATAWWVRADIRASFVMPAGHVEVVTVVGWGDSVLWIDARSQAEYAAGSVPGALHVDEARWDATLEPVLQKWEPGRRVVVYCSQRRCGNAEKVAARLRQELAMDEVYVLHGGWEAWRRTQ